MTTNNDQSAQKPANPKQNWIMRHKVLSVVIGLFVLVLVIAIATPSTPPAQETSSEPSISKACDDAFSSAAAVSDTEDTNENLFPAYSACQDLEAWVQADKLHPAAIDGENPIAYAANVCTNNKEEVGDTTICQAIAAGLAARQEPAQKEVSEPEPEPEPAPSETTSQKNAVSSAKDYLDYAAFSRSGLIEQLEFEQFSHEDAVYGADNSDADWNEQAAKSAQGYLDYSAFSRGGLIDQLLFEGFTQAQAEFGVNAVDL